MELFTFLLLVAIAALGGLLLAKLVEGVGLPSISGYILAGIIVGPYSLELITTQHHDHLRLVDSFALPFITLIAGAELCFKELRRNYAKIVFILTGIIAFCGIATFATIYFLAPYIPFLAEHPLKVTVAAALLGASILPAKSCSSLIAIIAETKAKGELVQIALGVTLLMDAVVILLFALSNSIAEAVLDSHYLHLGEVFAVLCELPLSIISGVLVGCLFCGLLKLKIPRWLIGSSVLVISFGLSELRELQCVVEVKGLHIRLFSEPLLEAMIAGMVVANGSRAREHFDDVLHTFAPAVFLLFFLSLGASIELDVLMSVWQAALILVLVRGVAMVAGCYFGALAAPGPSLEKRHLLGFMFITQAGVCLSLAKMVSSSHPGWGTDFATLIIGVIVINTIFGPWFTKGAIAASIEVPDEEGLLVESLLEEPDRSAA